MTVRCLIGGALAAAMLAGCFRQEIQTYEITVPAMRSADCSRIIQSALNRVEGVISVEPDIEARKVVITYNSTRVAQKNLEYVITGLGFDANDEIGKADARQGLPPDCR